LQRCIKDLHQKQQHNQSQQGAGVQQEHQQELKKSGDRARFAAAAARKATEALS
jgi:hypothetical protein